MFGNVAKHVSCVDLLHRKLGHASFKVVQKMNQYAEGLHVKECKAYLDCAVCKTSKSKAFPISKSSTRQTTRALELVHETLVGPMQTSLGGAKYMLVIVDDYSRFGFCYLLKSKTEVLQKFKQWIRFV
uniref:GAG-pre-integrase domain-containing protein n=1 Tax=Micrurus paraensis TaxID=1970185 RepID=A0A2D4K5N5_9SAUR